MVRHLKSFSNYYRVYLSRNKSPKEKGRTDGRETKIKGEMAKMIQTQIIFLKFVMKAEAPKDQLDYEEDVVNLKRVWAEIKEPAKKTVKETQSKTQAGTQTNKFKEAKETKETKDKTKSNKPTKTKVLVSEPHLKETVRNPKPEPGTIIEVVTHPEKKHSDPIRNQRNISAPHNFVLTNPEGQTLVDTQTLRKELAEKDYELSLLRVSNAHNSDKVKRLQGEVEKRDRVIDELKARERYLTTQLAELGSKDLNFNYGKVEYENYRQDSRRLLRMLKSTQEYQTFADFALEDDGVRFLTNAGKTIKTKLDVPPGQGQQIHFCTCNKNFIPEETLWVPEKVYDFGRDFIKDRQGEVSQTELELLLYELNKLWREREKRILNQVNGQKASEVGKYKRRLREVSRGHSGSGVRTEGKGE